MTKKGSKPRRAARRGRELPADACPACGTMMREARGRLKLPINGEEIAAPRGRDRNLPEEARAALGRRDPRHSGAVRAQAKRPGATPAPRREHGFPLGVRPQRSDGGDGHPAAADPRPAGQRRVPARPCGLKFLLASWDERPWTRGATSPCRAAGRTQRRAVHHRVRLVALPASAALGATPGATP